MASSHLAPPARWLTPVPSGFTVEAQTFLNDPKNMDKSLEILAKELQGSSQQVMRQSFEELLPHFTPTVTEDNLKAGLEFLKFTGELKPDVNVSYEEAVATDLMPKSR